MRDVIFYKKISNDTIGNNQHNKYYPQVLDRRAAAGRDSFIIQME